jgi:hypothetical protein
MTSTGQKPLHLLPVLHLIGVLALAIWWGVFFWQHSPAHTLLATSHFAASHAGSHGADPFSLTTNSSFLNSKMLIAARVAAPDLLLGISVLLLFGIASGVHVRQLDNWLHARASGDAVAFRGQDLTAATIEANTKEQRGVLR